jgi:hypothetical protein
MIWFSIKITKNFSLDFSFFHLVRAFKDGITFFNFVVELDLYKGDHNPQFNICLIIINFKIFEIDFYNINHLK